MRLGWKPGNEAGSGGLGMRLGWRSGNEAGVEVWWI